VIWPSRIARLSGTTGWLTLAAGISLLGAPLAGQSASGADTVQSPKAWTHPRTPWGDPDLQAIWSSEDVRDVPYERPPEFAGRRFLTDEEFARRTSAFTQSSARTPTGFTNASKTRTFRQTSLIVDPPDGRYPRLTPTALTRFRTTDIGTYGDGPFLGPEDLNLYDRCITRGVVGSILPVAYGNGMEIRQIPGFVVMQYEMVHETRVIPLDGRPHVAKNIHLYMGDPRGHWEGTTLVVETTNFTNRTSVGRNGYGPRNSEALRLIERFTRVGSDQIDYEVSVDDPLTWTRPFKMAFPITTQTGYQIFPYECHEGSSTIPEVLSAARAEEREAEEAARRGTPLPRRPPVWDAPEGVQVPR
jgi:hypothetical protein